MYYFQKLSLWKVALGLIKFHFILSCNDPTSVWSKPFDLWTSIFSRHQGSFLRRQALWPAGDQTYGGGQTREQEADEEGPGDSGTQSASETPTPPHRQPDRHVWNPQQLHSCPGDVSKDQKKLNWTKMDGISSVFLPVTPSFNYFWESAVSNLK